MNVKSFIASRYNTQALSNIGTYSQLRRKLSMLTYSEMAELDSKTEEVEKNLADSGTELKTDTVKEFLLDNPEVSVNEATNVLSAQVEEAKEEVEAHECTPGDGCENAPTLADAVPSEPTLATNSLESLHDSLHNSTEQFRTNNVSKDMNDGYVSGLAAATCCASTVALTLAGMIGSVMVALKSSREKWAEKFIDELPGLEQELLGLQEKASKTELDKKDSKRLVAISKEIEKIKSKAQNPKIVGMIAQLQKERELAESKLAAHSAMLKELGFSENSKVAAYSFGAFHEDSYTCYSTLKDLSRASKDEIQRIVESELGPGPIDGYDSWDEFWGDNTIDDAVETISANCDSKPELSSLSAKIDQFEEASELEPTDSELMTGSDVVVDNLESEVAPKDPIVTTETTELENDINHELGGESSSNPELGNGGSIVGEDNPTTYSALDVLNSSAVLGAISGGLSLADRALNKEKYAKWEAEDKVILDQLSVLMSELNDYYAEGDKVEVKKRVLKMNSLFNGMHNPSGYYANYLNDLIGMGIIKKAGWFTSTNMTKFTPAYS